MITAQNFARGALRAVALGLILGEPGVAAEVGQMKWSFATGASIGWPSAAIGADGTVYIGSMDGNIYALDAATGARKWAFAAAGSVLSSAALGADDTVYVGSESFAAQVERFFALDGSTGQRKWAFWAGSPMTCTPALGADGTVCVGDRSGVIQALDGATGTRKWAFAAEGAIWSSAAVTASGTVYVGSWDGKLYALDGVTGHRRWLFGTGGRLYSSPAIGADGTVYVGSDDRKLYALDGASGVEKWGFLAAGAVWSSPAVGVDGTVYFGSWDGSLYALDGTTGARKWASATGGPISWSSPALAADGTVYIGSDKVYALDGATGARKWEFVTGGRVNSSPALGPDGTVYVGSWNGMVYALHGSAGLASSPWPKFQQNAQNTGQQPFAPRFLGQPSRVVLNEDATGQIRLHVVGAPPPRFAWFFNGQRIPGESQATLTLAPVTRAAEGVYTLTASNTAGQVTSDPIAVVVSNVDPQPFVGLAWGGGSAGPVSLEATAELGADAAWHSVSNYPPSDTTQHYVDPADADPARFYRLNAEIPRPFSAVGLLSGWWMVEPAGSRIRVEVVSAATGWTNWQVLTNLILPASPYLFLDLDSLGAPERAYRTMTQ